MGMVNLLTFLHYACKRALEPWVDSIALWSRWRTKAIDVTGQEHQLLAVLLKAFPDGLLVRVRSYRGVPIGVCSRMWIASFSFSAQ